jgi:probable HAF family extracellular repeat protein
MKHRVLLAAVFALLVPLASAQVYTIRDLGPISPAAINDAGQIAGLDSNNHAVLWTAGHVRDLGVLPGGTYSVPNAINTVGAVVGMADGLVTYDPGVPYSKWTGYVPLSFVWTRSGGMQTLGYIDTPIHSPKDTSSKAKAINIFGQIIVYTAGPNDYANGHVWTKRGGLTELLPYSYNSEAIGINNRGQIVGWNGYMYPDDCSPFCSRAEGTYDYPKPSLWENGVLTELGIPPTVTDSWLVGFGGVGVAYDINDATQVVGWSAIEQSNEPRYWVHHAFLWTRKHGMEDLGTLPGDLSSVAKHINVFGHVIGSSYVDTQHEGRPFIWTRKQGMQDLNTLIDARSGWILRLATGINFRGEIVGSGTLNHATHGFLLTPHQGCLGNPWLF